MSWIISHPIVSLSYGFLYLSVLLLWFPGSRKIPYWSTALFLSLMFGLVNHQLDVIAVVPIIMLALAVYCFENKKLRALMRIIAGLFVFILSVGLARHQLPGFHNLNVLDHVCISRDAIPFTLYLNVDETVVGIFILGLGGRLISRKSEWFLLIKQIVVKGPAVIVMVMIAAFALGFVQFDFKIPESIFIWAVTNLLFVSVAEEAFFRGFVQKNIASLMKKIKQGDIIALSIAAVLFGLVHYPGGIKYVILATIAGMGYGWIYSRTKRIEASILTHFGLNMMHFLLFTYPALGSAM